MKPCGFPQRLCVFFPFLFISSGRCVHGWFSASIALRLIQDKTVPEDGLIKKIKKRNQLKKEKVLKASRVSNFTNNFGMLSMWCAVGTRIPLNLSFSVQRSKQMFHNVYSQCVQVADEQYVGAENCRKETQQKPTQHSCH